jgi:hypothetical protein
MSGPIEEIRTLRDGAKLVLALDQPRQQTPIWICAAGALAEAAKSGHKRRIEAARLQLISALQHEGWL